MSALISIARQFWLDNPARWIRGLILSILVLVAGIALLGLSGWFITSAGIAGLIGAGLTYDVFRPSAGVRFLALGRTVSRYGERLLTHDATLKSLASMRVRLLNAVVNLPYKRTLSFRSSNILNRITSDVDTLDAISLRLITPLLAAGATLLIVTPLLIWLTDWRIALGILAIIIPTVIFTLLLAAKKSHAVSDKAEIAFQEVRTHTIDLVRSRTELVVFGVMQNQHSKILDADKTSRDALRVINNIERNAGLIIQLTITGAAALTFVLGAALARQGNISVAQAALAFFVVIALLECFAPLKRGVLELGRMIGSAKRINALLQEPSVPTTPKQNSSAPELRLIYTNKRTHQSASVQVRNVEYRTPGSQKAILHNYSFDLSAGEKLALTGPSGCGKSTVLLLVAGLLKASDGQVFINGTQIIHRSEPHLRQLVSLLPQRSMLLGGTIREVLQLANPDLCDEEAWRVLDAVDLKTTLQTRGGLDYRLHEAGTGLSGGEQRRLALARVLLRQTPILLLDEPTEGLDKQTAERVLNGIDQYTQNAAVLIAAHRPEEVRWANRVSRINSSTDFAGIDLHQLTSANVCENSIRNCT